MKKQWKIKICITFSVCVWMFYGCAQNNQEKSGTQALDMETDVMADKEQDGNEPKLSSVMPEIIDANSGGIENNSEILDIYSQVVEGDLTALSRLEIYEEIISIYEKHSKFNDLEWRLADIDYNGYEELVWQEKEDVGYMKRIVGLFSFEKESKCIIWDLNDGSEFYFISDSGNLVYYDQYFGIYRFFSLESYTLDENLNLDFTYGLWLYDIYDLLEIDEKFLLKLQKSNPDIKGEGIYYQKIISQDNESRKIKESLTEEQFVNEFTDLMGIDFYEFYREIG